MSRVYIVFFVLSIVCAFLSASRSRDRAIVMDAEAGLFHIYTSGAVFICTTDLWQFDIIYTGSWHLKMRFRQLDAIIYAAHVLSDWFHYRSRDDVSLSIVCSSVLRAKISSSEVRNMTITVCCVCSRCRHHSLGMRRPVLYAVRVGRLSQYCIVHV